LHIHLCCYNLQIGKQWQAKATGPLPIWMNVDRKTVNQATGDIHTILQQKSFFLLAASAHTPLKEKLDKVNLIF